MTALSLLQQEIKANDWLDFTFFLFCHNAEVNWRQLNASFESKIAHVDTAVKFDTCDPMPLKGSEFLDKSFITNYSCQNTLIISLASKVIDLQGNEMHLLMMNMHFDFPITVNKIRGALDKLISDKYFLLRTDRFYHLYCFKLYNLTEWKERNLEFLKTDSLVSPRYIGHSLKRGFNLLRLNSLSNIKTMTPTVVYHDAETINDVEVFAITKHGAQTRIGGQSYFWHLYETREIAKDIISEIGLNLSIERFNELLKVALLHDVIEDTNTDFEEIELLFGHYIASSIATLSNDKRKPYDLRNQEYFLAIKNASIEIKIIKLADILSNLRAVPSGNNEEWARKFILKCEMHLEMLRPEFGFINTYHQCQVLLSQHSQ